MPFLGYFFNNRFLALKKCDIKWRRIQVCFAVHSINSLNDTQRFTKKLQLMSWRSNQRSLYFLFSKHKTCIIILMITEISTLMIKASHKDTTGLQKNFPNNLILLFLNQYQFLQENFSLQRRILSKPHLTFHGGY